MSTHFASTSTTSSPRFQLHILERELHFFFYPRFYLLKMLDNIENTAMAEPIEGHSKRAEALNLTAQLLAFAKSEDRPYEIDFGHLLSSQWLHFHTEWNKASLRPIPAGIELEDAEHLIPFPREWFNREAFDEAINGFNSLVNPYLPSWLPSVALCNDPVFNHEIVWPVQCLERDAWVDLDPHNIEARFIHKCADIGYSVLESKRGREVLQKILKDIITRWDEEGENHAFQYGRRNNRRFRQASDTVDYFLNVLRLMPPTVKLQEVGDIEGSWIHGKMILTEVRTKPIALDEFVPQSEFEIHIQPDVSKTLFPSSCPCI